jgi:glycosyltransferase involved in cell wall biosynthesis
MKALSFCTTCKNRRWQLEKTLPKNLADNRRLKNKIEFIVVDFDSRDGLGEWIKKDFARELKEGYLKYYHTSGLPHWHMSVAKNTAHLCATGKLVTNLDGDNYTGKNGAQFILNCFRMHKSPIVLHQHSGDWLDGSCGRVSVERNLFACLGGYDETFAPMGFEDLDLMVRLWKIGVRYVNVKNSHYNKAIRNTKEDSLAYCNSPLSFYEMDMTNQHLSLQKFIGSECPVRNEGQYGVKSAIYDHRGAVLTPAARTYATSGQLIRHYKLQPPGDLTFALKAVYALG